MSHVSPEQFQAFMTLVMALVSAIAAFVAAIKGGQAHAEATAAHAEAKAARAEVAAAATAGPLAAPTSLPTGINLGDLFKYAATIREILTLLRSIGTLTLGSTVPVPRTVFDLPGGERIELAATTATRLR